MNDKRQLSFIQRDILKIAYLKETHTERETWWVTMKRRRFSGLTHVRLKGSTFFLPKVVQSQIANGGTGDFSGGPRPSGPG